MNTKDMFYGMHFDYGIGCGNFIGYGFETKKELDDFIDSNPDCNRKATYKDMQEKYGNNFCVVDNYVCTFHDAETISRL